MLRLRSRSCLCMAFLATAFVCLTTFHGTSPAAAAEPRPNARAIERVARKHKDALAPCEFLAWKDESVEVKLVEREEGKKLIGPAGFNEICVADGAIYSDVVPSGVYTDINYMRAIAKGAAASIEKDEGNLSYHVKTIKHLSDLNLEIPEVVREHMEGQQKSIKVGGAVFVTIESRLLEAKAYGKDNG